MGIFADSITVVAPIMGLLLVAATFYINNIIGDIEDANEFEIKVASAMFFISFLGGGGLLMLSIWEPVSALQMRLLLTEWIALSALTGALLAGRMVVALLWGVDEIPYEGGSEVEIPTEGISEDSSAEIGTPGEEHMEKES